jgi:hypothetical protein
VASLPPLALALADVNQRSFVVAGGALLLLALWLYSNSQATSEVGSRLQMSALPNATTVLLLTANRKGGDRELYRLTSDGIETRTTPNGEQHTRTVDMGGFWTQWEAPLATVVAERAAGWDQIRLHSERTSQPIHFITVVDRAGNTRKFSIYGVVAPGARLERSEHTLARHYSDLFAHMSHQP